MGRTKPEVEAGPLVAQSRPSPAPEGTAGAVPVRTWAEVQTAALHQTGLWDSSYKPLRQTNRQFLKTCRFLQRIQRTAVSVLKEPRV